MELRVTNTVLEHRQRMRYTQEELGERVAVTRQTIIAIEKGNYMPSVGLALKLAHVFHITVDKLFFLCEN